MDVRDACDLAGQVGHIEGVSHLPASELMARGPGAVSDDQPLALVCGRGDLSADCAQSLVQDWGHAEVYVLVGGMSRWTAEECPVSFHKSWKTL